MVAINAFTSDKIRVLSFASIIMVLYIHSDFHDYPHEILGMAGNHLLQEVVSGWAVGCAALLHDFWASFLPECRQPRRRVPEDAQACADSARAIRCRRPLHASLSPCRQSGAASRAICERRPAGTVTTAFGRHHPQCVLGSAK